MHRRSFLTSLAALGIVPALPLGALSSTATQAVSYNRYMYGVGVFHARTRASLTAAELAAKMAIPQAQAKIMIGEMMSRGVVSPLSGSAGMVRAVNSIQQPNYSARDLIDKATDWLDQHVDDEIGLEKTETTQVPSDADKTDQIADI